MTVTGTNLDDVLAKASEAQTAAQPDEAFDDKATAPIVSDPAAPESEFAAEEPTRPHTFRTLGDAVDQGTISPSAALATFTQIGAKRRNNR